MVDELLAEILSRPLDEVVAARDEAVRSLRREKRVDEAAQLARLRRPSPPLWAVNRLHDVDPQGLAALLEAGDEVRQAQAALLGGQGDAARRMAEAGDRLNSAVRHMTRSAMHVLVDEGHGAGADAERKLQSMLRAAAVGDETARQALVEGRLLAEPQPAGFDLLAGASVQPRAAVDVAEPSPTPRDRARPAAPADDRARAAAVVAEREKHMELERAVAQRRQAAERAERDAAERRGHIAALQTEAGELQRRMHALTEQIAAERAAAETAQAVAAEARAALERAQVALGDAGGTPIARPGTRGKR